MKLKLILATAALGLLAACSQKPDATKAQACAEGLLNDIKAEKYDNLGRYYSNTANETENQEKRTEKLKQMKEVLGPVESYALSDSKEIDGEQAAMMFTYKVKHSKINTLEKITVVKDEGDYKVLAHQVESENLK